MKMRILGRLPRNKRHWIKVPFKERHMGPPWVFITEQQEETTGNTRKHWKVSKHGSLKGLCYREQWHPEISRKGGAIIYFHTAHIKWADQQVEKPRWGWGMRYFIHQDTGMNYKHAHYKHKSPRQKKKSLKIYEDTGKSENFSFPQCPECHQCCSDNQKNQFRFQLSSFPANHSSICSNFNWAETRTSSEGLCTLIYKLATVLLKIWIRTCHPILSLLILLLYKSPQK